MKRIGGCCRLLWCVRSMSHDVGNLESVGGARTGNSHRRWVYNGARCNVGQSGAASLVRSHSLPAGFGDGVFASSNDNIEFVPLLTFREEDTGQLRDVSANPECASPTEFLQVGSRAEVSVSLGERFVSDGAR